MAKFLKKILVSLLFTLLVCILMDLWLSNYLQHSSKRKYEIWTKIVNGEFQDNDLLVFGSSRAWVHYSPVILDSVLGVNSYNMGIDGSACDRQILRWELYKRFGNAKPRYIIHNIDYVSTLYSTNGYERDQFFPYFWNMDFRNLLFKFENFSFAEKYIPMYRYTAYGVMNLLNFDVVKLNKGYEGQNRKWDASSFDKKNTIDFSYSSDVELFFDSYIKSVKEDGIELIFVMSPMYYGAKEKCTQLELMYTTYKRLSQKYNIPLLDYTFSEISKDTTNFYNATHLNKKGSELFSKELANDLKKNKIDSITCK